MKCYACDSKYAPIRCDICLQFMCYNCLKQVFSRWYHILMNELCKDCFELCRTDYLNDCKTRVKNSEQLMEMVYYSGEPDYGFFSKEELDI